MKVTPIAPNCAAGLPPDIIDTKAPPPTISRAGITAMNQPTIVSKPRTTRSLVLELNPANR
jgi:hypothetical protein